MRLLRSWRLCLRRFLLCSAAIRLIRAFLPVKQAVDRLLILRLFDRLLLRFVWLLCRICCLRILS